MTPTHQPPPGYGPAPTHKWLVQLNDIISLVGYVQILINQIRTMKDML